MVGKQVAADLDFSGEGLVYDSQGVAIQGITNGSIWDQNFARTRVTVINECRGGEKIELWVEAAANSLLVFLRILIPKNKVQSVMDGLMRK